jgi:hypothetical protein
MEHLVTRPINDTDRIWLSAFIIQRWGADRVIGHDTPYVPSQLAGLVAKMN